MLASAVAVVSIPGGAPDLHRTWSVTDLGAVPDDDNDDAGVIQAALDSLRPGDTLTFPAGIYLHSEVLTVRVPGVTLSGAGTVVATDEARSAVRVDADRVTIRGLTLGVATTTRRFSEPAQQKLWISGHTGAVVEDVTITGSAAAGIFVEGASEFRLERPRVSDTRADGIHVTGGSHTGLVDAPVVARTGDDGIAVVSYERDGPQCHDITVIAPVVMGTSWGRGLSVVGGSGITYTDVLVEDSDAAAVYVAVEDDPYFTAPVADVVVKGGRLLRSNHNPGIDHGAVVVLAGRRGRGVSGVEIADLVLEDTRASASRQVSVVTAAGAQPPVGLRFERLSFRGGPRVAVGGNTPADSYRVVG